MLLSFVVPASAPGRSIRLVQPRKVATRTPPAIIGRGLIFSAQEKERESLEAVRTPHAWSEHFA